ncbi:hypothetical protein [Streptomyces ginkgonis]|uniref:hypothetical protein n=1 Tax=Streptomyces ginkgonis TaxID=1812259 RepID=UPI002176A412|nr:hypothetical protein [Streptomyces ginkgonis]
MPSVKTTTGVPGTGVHAHRDRPLARVVLIPDRHVTALIPALGVRKRGDDAHPPYARLAKPKDPGRISPSPAHASDGERCHQSTGSRHRESAGREHGGVRDLPPIPAVVRDQFRGETQVARAPGPPCRQGGETERNAAEQPGQQDQGAGALAHDQLHAPDVDTGEEEHGKTRSRAAEREPPPRDRPQTVREAGDDEPDPGDREPRTDGERGDEEHECGPQGFERSTVRDAGDVAVLLPMGGEDGPVLQPRPFLGHPEPPLPSRLVHRHD